MMTRIQAVARAVFTAQVSIIGNPFDKDGQPYDVANLRLISLSSRKTGSVMFGAHSNRIPIAELKELADRCELDLEEITSEDQLDKALTLAQFGYETLCEEKLGVAPWKKNQVS